MTHSGYVARWLDGLENGGAGIVDTGHEGGRLAARIQSQPMVSQVYLRDAQALDMDFWQDANADI